MFRRIEEANGKFEVVISYLGLLMHGNAKRLRQEIMSCIYAPHSLD
jgi:hypothetical protein